MRDLARRGGNREQREVDSLLSCELVYLDIVVVERLVEIVKAQGRNKATVKLLSPSSNLSPPSASASFVQSAHRLVRWTIAGNRHNGSTAKLNQMNKTISYWRQVRLHVRSENKKTSRSVRTTPILWANHILLVFLRMSSQSEAWKVDSSKIRAVHCRPWTGRCAAVGT